jgi:hypothetical protein
VSSDSSSGLKREVNFELRCVCSLALGLSNYRLWFGLEHFLELRSHLLFLHSSAHLACLFLLHLHIPFGLPERPGSDRNIIDYVLEDGTSGVE